MSRILIPLALLVGLTGPVFAAQGKGQDKGKKEKKVPPGQAKKSKGQAKKGPPRSRKKGCGDDLSDILKALREFHKGKQLATVERVMRDHFGKLHRGETTCHCSCGHTRTAGKGKGNNGVGNGIDPQPPGNPPVNDGPGTGPGNPGNKKGKGKKGSKRSP